MFNHREADAASYHWFWDMAYWKACCNAAVMFRRQSGDINAEQQKSELYP
jgi:hypothetical protein